MADPTRVSIAVVGAGIAGLTAAIALQSHPGVDVQIYERATKLEEIGASIALGPNGLRTLEKLGVDNALTDEVGFRNQSGFPMVYRHWKTNEVLSVDEHHGTVEYRHRTTRFHRAHLHQALLEHVPASQIHLGKSFASTAFDSVAGKNIINFKDGTSVTADILFGADGIHSEVRRFFVPGSVPKWTGWVAFRSTFDTKLVEDIEGLPDDATHWWGHERTFFASRLGKGLFTIVGSYQGDPDSPEAQYKSSKWNSEGDLNTLREYYKDWHPVIRRLVEASPYTRLYPNASAPRLDTWAFNNGLATLGGDAAHAHGGAFAAGGSLAIDDAYAFSLAIRHVYPPEDVSSGKPSIRKLQEALRLYEKTRRPHTEKVILAVQESNKKKVERLGEAESDEQLRTRAKGRGDPHWIHEHDVEATFWRAVEDGKSGPVARL